MKVRMNGDRERRVARGPGGGPQRVSVQALMMGVVAVVVGFVMKVVVLVGDDAAGGRVRRGWPAFYAGLVP